MALQDLKKEKLKQSDIIEYIAFVMGEAKNYSDKTIFKQLNARNYLNVKTTTFGEEIAAFTLQPYFDKDGDYLTAENQFGSNTIKEWAYFFENDRDKDRNIPDKAIVWLPINPDDFENRKEIVASSYDTLVSMLGLTLASTFTLNKDDFEGYQETLTAIGAFKENSNYCLEKGFKPLPEAEFEEQATAASVFSAIIQYMLAVAKDGLNPRDAKSDMPFIGAAPFVSAKRTNSTVYRGIAKAGRSSSMLTSLFGAAAGKGKK